MSRVDTSETDTRCYRSDHDHARILNAARQAAEDKHGANSIEAVAGTDGGRFLAILVEEVGELAHELTYDAVKPEVIEALADAGKLERFADGHVDVSTAKARKVLWAVRRARIAAEVVDVMTVASAYLDALRADGLALGEVTDTWVVGS